MPWLVVWHGRPRPVVSCVLRSASCGGSVPAPGHSAAPSFSPHVEPARAVLIRVVPLTYEVARPTRFGGPRRMRPRRGDPGRVRRRPALVRAVRSSSLSRRVTRWLRRSVISNIRWVIMI
ncbi:exported hypothetical protein [Frankia sp. Hr75.2]|nr:exported hypothetical protein [Frankia sp. Hr75.2]